MRSLQPRTDTIIHGSAHQNSLEEVWAVYIIAKRKSYIAQFIIIRSVVSDISIWNSQLLSVSGIWIKYIGLLAWMIVYTYMQLLINKSIPNLKEYIA